MYNFVLIRFYLTLIFLFIGFVGTSQITADKYTGCAPLTVSFSPPAGMTTYYWDFDNGGSSQDANPNVVFSTPKNPYKVSLRACKTCPILHTIEIKVFPKPSVTIPKVKGCPPLVVNFNPVFSLPPGVTASSVKYIFGDGNSQTKMDPNISPATNTYTEKDRVYPVSFEIKTSPTSAGCDHTVVIPGAVETSSITFNWLQASPAAGCSPPLNVNFTHSIISAKPIVSYDWDFGNGVKSTAALPSYIYTLPGTYTVTLKVKDENGCEKTQATVVNVKENDMTKIVSLDTICLNRLLRLDIDGNSGLTPRWTLSNGSVVVGRPVYESYSTPGLKTITVTSYYPGNVCPKTITKKVLAIKPEIKHTVTPLPLCNKTNTFTLTCTNANEFTDIQWSMDFVNFYSDTNQIKVFGTNFTQPVTYTLDLDSIPWSFYKILLRARATSKYGGCIVEMIDPNFINPFIAHVAPTITEGCKPLNVGFYDRSLLYRRDTIDEWKLFFGDGISVTKTSFNSIHNHTYANRGDYKMYMIAKNKHGCIDTTYMTTIKVGDKYTPDFTITPPGNICSSDPNASIRLQSLVSPSLVQKTKFWADGFACVQFDNLTFKPHKSVGTYPIKMEVIDRGCVSSITKTITIKGPHASFIDTQYCDTPKKVSFTNLSQEATSYLWTFGDGNTSADMNPIHKYANDGIYTVKLIAFHASNGCPADTYALKVQIQTPKAILQRDTFFYCHDDLGQPIYALASTGYVNDGINSGFIWDFMNGRGPTRSFIGNIEYDVRTKLVDTVILSVRNFMNCISSDTATLIVDKIDLNYTVAPNLICNGDTIKYKGTMHTIMPITIQNWNFGDGTNANKLDTFHVYKFGMRSSIFFTNTFYAQTGQGCFIQVSERLNVKKLNLTLDTVSRNICLQSSTVPVSISAKVDSPYRCSIQWLGPDNSINYGKTIAHTFADTGKYNFQLIATDSFNSNCKDTVFPAAVRVHIRPNLSIQSDKDTLNVLCNPVNLDLSYFDTNNTSIITRKWVVTDSTGSAVYNGNTQISRSLHKGMNKVVLTVATAYCLDTVERNFIVRAPAGSMTIDKNDICKGDEITFNVTNLVDVSDYSIDLGDGTVISNTPIIKHKYNYVPIGGSTVATGIFLASGYECVGKPSDTIIRIHEAFAKFSIDGSADTPICYRAVLIKDSSIGADKYYWDFGDGTFGTMKEPGMRTYLTAGKYLVSLAIENISYGCKDTFKDSVLLVTLPESNPTNDTICFGDTAKIYQLRKQNSVKYSWKPSGFHVNNQLDTVFYRSDSSFNFSAIAKDTSTNCQKISNGSVMVIQRMKPVKLDTTIAPGADITLPFSPLANYSFQWNPDSFLNCTDCKDPVAKYILNPIKYTVIFNDKIKNCFTDTSTYKIKIFPDILIDAPTAFTPNGDGNNDIFFARGFGIKKLTSFKIYNRQGTLLFFSTSEFDGWDGNYKDMPQNSDTYFYTIEGESFIPNKNVSKEGNFLLLR